MKADAVVFGLYETGLGVARSLGSMGVSVTGVDHKKDMGFYSRFVQPLLCPHPVGEEQEFIHWVKDKFAGLEKPVPVFFSSDDFLIAFSRNREHFRELFLFNMVDHSFIESISDKYKQAKLALDAGVDVPVTYEINTVDEMESLPATIEYPLFVKGRDVNSWRKRISGNVKGFRIENKTQLNEKLKEILLRDVPVILQEIIEGPDTNHFKYNTYISVDGSIAGEFALQKIRQNPPHFGVGAVVQSLQYPELFEIGRKLFAGIDFRGIGSAEFKKDERDGKLKLIEINPRYWQQNYLATYCGVNFPYYNYADLTGASFKVNTVYKTNVKWINRQLDFDSFVKYRKEGLLTFKSWSASRKGEKVISDFTWNDPIPALYNIEFGLKLLKAPLYLFKKVF